MFIAGVSLSAGSAAFLALLLSRAGHSSLAQRIGIAVDRDVGHFALMPGDMTKLLDVLDDPPASLAELRSALLRERA